MLRPIPTNRIRWKEIKEELVGEMEVEDYEFMSVEEACREALPKLQLFNRVLDTAQKK